MELIVMDYRYEVFISYSTDDQKVVEGICAYLEQHHIRCFVAYRDIPAGVVWAKAIVDCLDNSRICWLCFPTVSTGQNRLTAR